MVVIVYHKTDYTSALMYNSILWLWLSPFQYYFIPLYPIIKENISHNFHSLFAIWDVGPLGLGPLPFKSQNIPQKSRSSCLIAVSPRGSNEAKETAGMTVFFYQSNAIISG